MSGSNLIEVQVNGERRQIPSGSSVADLLKRLEIQSERVAVELNKQIVRQRDWNEAAVPSGSQVEIVEFVGGG